MAAAEELVLCFLRGIDEDADFLALRVEKHRAPHEGHHSERGDKGWDLQLGDDQAIEQADGTTHGKRGGHRSGDTVLGDDIRPEARRQGEDRAHGQIETSGCDGEGHPKPEDGDEGRLIDEIGDVSDGQEVLVGKGKGSPDHSDDH